MKEKDHIRNVILLLTQEYRFIEWEMFIEVAENLFVSNTYTSSILKQGWGYTEETLARKEDISLFIVRI